MVPLHLTCLPPVPLSPEMGATPQDAGTFQISLVINGQYSPFGPIQWPHVSLSQGPPCLCLGDIFLCILESSNPGPEQWGLASCPSGKHGVPSVGAHLACQLV